MAKVTIYLATLGLSNTPLNCKRQLEYRLEKYLSPAQVADAIPGMTIGALAQLRYLGTGPKFRKPTAKTVVYVEQEVAQWIEASARMKTGDVSA